MKYRVSINYYRFLFSDRMEAIDFADMAKAHANDKDISVNIELVNEEESDGI